MLERYFTNKEIYEASEWRNNTLEHMMTNKEIHEESQKPVNTEKMWGFIVANNREYSVTLDLNSDETKCLTFLRSNYGDIPIEKTLIASQVDIDTAMEKYDEMSRCSALSKMENWKNCLKEIEESGVKTQILTEGYSDEKLKIGVAYEKEGKVIFNSIDVINKSYQPEEFESVLKENRWGVEESRQPLTRSFDLLEKTVTNGSHSTDNPIIKKILEGQEHITVAQENGFNVKLHFKGDSTLVELHRDLDKCIKKCETISTQRALDNAMRTFENLSQWPIKRDCVEDIVKDLREMEPSKKADLLLSIYEDTLFNRRISPEISLEQNKTYAQAAEYVINHDYANTEVQAYLEFMKVIPHKPMIFDDYNCLKVQEVFQLREEGYRKKLMDIQKEGHETRKVVSQVNGQKREIGTIYKKEGKLILNTRSFADKVCSVDEFKEMMEKKHYKIEESNPGKSITPPAIEP